LDGSGDHTRGLFGCDKGTGDHQDPIPIAIPVSARWISGIGGGRKIIRGLHAHIAYQHLFTGPEKPEGHTKKQKGNSPKNPPEY